MGLNHQEGARTSTRGSSSLIMGLLQHASVADLTGITTSTAHLSTAARPPMTSSRRAGASAGGEESL